MKRKCDLCDQEATVHEVVIREGKKVERNFCEAHAKEGGITVHSQAHASINELITKFVMSHAGPAQPGAKPAACPGCGITFAEFRQQGLLGCADCYRTFEPQIGPLLERAHEGGTHHIGKLPKRGGGSLDRQERIAALRKQLSDALACEQYEKAAEIRDQLMGGEPQGRQPGRPNPGGERLA